MAAAAPKAKLFLARNIRSAAARYPPLLPLVPMVFSRKRSPRARSTPDKFADSIQQDQAMIAKMIQQEERAGDDTVAGKKRKKDRAPGSSRKKMKKFSTKTGFVYRKAWDVDLRVLVEDPSAQPLLESLGLDGFAAEPLPALDRSLCDEFLCNFDRKTSSSSVRGKLVKINASTVSQATKLPVGDEENADSDIDSISKSEKNLALRAILLDPDKTISSRGHSVDNFALGENVEVWRAVCELLMIKLECRRECFNTVHTEVLLALDRSRRQGVKMQWAKYMSSMIARAAGVGAKCSFPFGEWLTGIIKDQLEEPDHHGEEGRDVPETMAIAIEETIVGKSRNSTPTTDVGTQTEDAAGLEEEVARLRRENASIKKRADKLLKEFRAMLLKSKATRNVKNRDVESKSSSGREQVPPAAPPGVSSAMFEAIAWS